MPKSDTTSRRAKQKRAKAGKGKASGRPRLEMRLTRAGWIFSLIAITASVASVKSQLAMTYVLAGAMCGALIVSAWVAYRAIGGLTPRRELTDRAWQNQTVHLGYFIRNHRRIGCMSIRIEEIASQGLLATAGYCVYLPPRGLFRSGARFTVTRRGRIRLGALRISTSFPFGLIYGSKTIQLHDDLVVWPARGALRRELLLRGAQESAQAPGHENGGQNEFFGLREYREGDNPRWIHWRKSAGRLSPLLREMSRPQPEMLLLIVDTFCAPLCGDLHRSRRESMLRMAATLIDHAFARGWRVGLSLGQGGQAISCQPDSNKARRAQLLDLLADVQDDEPLTLEQVIAGTQRSHVRQAQVVVLCADQTAGATPALAAIRPLASRVSVVTPATIDALFADPLAVQAPPGQPEAI